MSTRNSAKQSEALAPVLIVAKWMAAEDEQHYDDVILAVVDDVSISNCRDILAAIWESQTDADGRDRSVVGFDAEIDDAIDESILANRYKPVASGIGKPARWDIHVIVSTDPAFWEFLKTGGIGRYSVEPLFDTDYFTRQLREWAKASPSAAMDWIGAKPWLSEGVAEDQKGKARSMATAMRRLVKTAL